MNTSWRKYFVLIVAVAACTTNAAVGALAADEGKTANIELTLQDGDVRAAIQAFFQAAGVNYAIDPEVQGVVPSLSFKGVPFEVALRSLVKAAGLVYRVSDGIYIISKKPDVSTTTASLSTTLPTTTDTTVVDTTTAEETIIEKVPLSNTGASEILAMMNGNTSGSSYGYGSYGGYGGGFGGYGGGFGSYGGYGGGFGGYGGGFGSYGGYGGGFGSYGGYGGYGSYGSYGSYGRSSYGGYGGYRSW